MNWIENLISPSSLPSTVLAIISIVIGITATIVAYYKSRREKWLQFEVLPSEVVVGGAVSEDVASRIVISFLHKDNTTEVVPRVYLSRIAFSNLGKEPIRKEDLSSSDPLTLIADGDARILDVAIVQLSRPATSITLDAVQLEDKRLARIRFDFLDYRDRAVIQVLATDAVKLRLVGTIIGMPRGIQQRSELHVTKHIWLYWAMVSFNFAAVVVIDIQIKTSNMGIIFRDPALYGLIKLMNLGAAAMIFFTAIITLLPFVLNRLRRR